MLSDFEKKVYNTYLRIVKTKTNKPYKLRKNFETLNERTQAVLIRLSRLIIENDIDIEKYFEAPYHIHTDTSYLPFDFFMTPRAIKLYKIYIEKLSRLQQK